jgi:hypothetical protein
LELARYLSGFEVGGQSGLSMREVEVECRSRRLNEKFEVGSGSVKW